jgi:hypothetical protein
MVLVTKKSIFMRLTSLLKQPYCTVHIPGFIFANNRFKFDLFYFILPKPKKTYRDYSFHDRSVCPCKIIQNYLDFSQRCLNFNSSFT